ncbi:DUF642 domain-containing protein [Alteromonas sp. ASW11-36]|uniref:DUF642 domain-containing protein n=1 Tax=Alteromonas arenosi TaxID=3055817 RepID=A0ABT7SYF7_9ALTE|nr:DUF642 domain-containing protein [Alteromonas sp. ASW11-36]MDM7860564.1 DUF642 domain-containing protein [Alteromonas sp. ASW11-36]
MKQFIAFSLLLLAVWSSNADANLIVNGSFEDNDVRANTWRWFASDKVNGWQGSNLEIWNSFRRVNAVDGSQFAELNAHGQRGRPFTISQIFDTTAGQIYDLSFYYSARRSNKEAFQVDVEDNAAQSIFRQIMDDHVKGRWSYFSTQFVAFSNQTRLSFSSVFPYTGTVGNFIDDVRVVGAQTVSEPGSLLLALISAAGIIWLRIKRKVVKSA